MNDNQNAAPQQKTPWLGYIILALVLLFLVGTCKSCYDGDSGTETEQEEAPLSLTPEQENILREAEQSGYIDLRPHDNEVWVKPLFWLACDYQAKQNLAYFCAIKCAEAQGNRLYYCTVRDSQDGKKLAKYSRAWGFDIE